LYSRWKIHSVAFEWAPCCATTEPGELVGFCTTDPLDQFYTLAQADTDPDSVLRVAFAYDGVSKNQVFLPGRYTCVPRTEGDLWLMDTEAAAASAPDSADQRLTSAGTFFLLCGSDITDTAQGQLFISYDIELLDSQVSTQESFNGCACISGAGTMTASAPFGTLPRGNVIGMSVNTDGSNVYVSPIPGTPASNVEGSTGPYVYLCTLAINGTNMSTTTNPISANIGNGITSVESFVLISTRNVVVFQFYQLTTDPEGYYPGFQISVSGSGATVTSCILNMVLGRYAGLNIPVFEKRFGVESTDKKKRIRHLARTLCSKKTTKVSDVPLLKRPDRWENLYTQALEFAASGKLKSGKLQAAKLTPNAVPISDLDRLNIESRVQELRQAAPTKEDFDRFMRSFASMQTASPTISSSALPVM